MRHKCPELPSEKDLYIKDTPENIVIPKNKIILLRAKILPYDFTGKSEKQA